MEAQLPQVPQRGQVFEVPEAHQDLIARLRETKKPVATGIYRDADKDWISAMAPILTSQGVVAGVLRVDLEAGPALAENEARLAGRRFVLGDDYTVVDMAVWGWSRLIGFVLGAEAVKQYPNLQRHLAEISARPAAAKALALKDRHAFKAEMDEQARLAMFPHLGKKVA